jgi:hypothetical protein
MKGDDMEIGTTNNLARISARHRTSFDVAAGTPEGKSFDALVQSASEVGNSKPSKLPKLEKLDVEKFLADYRHDLTEAGNPPQLIEDVVNHQRRMFTDPAYFERWNAASTQEQEIMIHGGEYNVRNMTLAEMREMADKLRQNGEISNDEWWVLTSDPHVSINSNITPGNNTERYDYLGMHTSQLELMEKHGNNGITLQRRMVSVLKNIDASHGIEGGIKTHV